MTLAVPRTSFVIPARNAGQTLLRTLDSLLAQGDGNWEALIVDDGSTDETPQIIAAHAQRDGRFIELRGSGIQGAAAARNVGLQHAHGRRLVFLDSDDWIDPVFLERMNAALDAAPGAAAVYCDYHRVMPDGEIAPAHSDPEVARAPFDTFARTCAVAIHAVLIEREWVLRAGGFDAALRTCEDWDLWQRVARLGSRWVHVAEPLAFYRTSEKSLSQDTDRVLADATVVVRRGYGHDPRLPSSESAHAAGAKCSQGFSFDIALAYCVLWCDACDAGRGRNRTPAHEALAALPKGRDHAPDIAHTLLDGVIVGLRAAPRQLAARWADYGGLISALVGEIGMKWGDAVAARRVQYAFERLVLQHDDLAALRTLSLTMGLRVDLRAPVSLTLPPGVDRLYVQLCNGARALDLAEPGALGNFAPQQWFELAARRLGWKAVLRIAGPALVRSVTPRRLAAAARSARCSVRHAALREHGWRRVVKGAARAALMAVAVPSVDGSSHSAELQRLREQVERDAPSATAQPALAHAGHGAASQEAPAGDRRACWDDFFRAIDPWNYGSAYEQEKYGFQLELLPEGPIGTALELACAEGRFTDKLAPRVQRLIATDISATALARAAERCHGHPHIDFRTLDLLVDELPQGLDVIVCSEVLYFLDDEAQLRHAAERMAAALKPGGHLITANALVLPEDMSRTGFDWGTPWAATTIARVFAEVLTPQRSLHTELYRVDCFARGPLVEKSLTETRTIRAEIDHDVARYVVWGGAVALRSELGHTERHQRMPVLAYHRVADDGPPGLARYRVSPAAFAEQMAWLRRHGYHAIVADELAWFLQHQHPFVGRPVMITFDDGYQDFADNAWPMLRRHDLCAEVFVVTNLVGGRAEWDGCCGEPAPLMDAKTIAALATEGARFGSHLATHRCADGLSTRDLAEELLRSQRCIAQWTGLQPCALAAPFGLTDQRLEGLAAQCGYAIGFSAESAAASLSCDPMRVPRIDVRGDMAMDEFESVLESCR